LESLPNWLEEEGRTIDRKLNVALTRARKQLHLVGNRELLMGNGVYRRLIEEVEEG
jgi:superfamily I DNA and/or RNA helicase